MAISALLIYIGSKISAGGRFSVWTLEMTMLVVIAALGLLFMPIAVSPPHTMAVLTDVYLKTVIIFILMVNLIDTRQRIFSLWKLVVVCGAALGVGAIRSYMKGEFTMRRPRPSFHSNTPPVAISPRNPPRESVTRTPTVRIAAQPR